MLVWNAISSIVLMMRATLLLDSWIDSIETTISDSALFESSTRPCTSVTSTAASCACLALVRVIVAICSSDAEVSSSEAACSFEPIDSDCAEDATCPAAEAICVAPVRSVPIALRSMPTTARRIITTTTTAATTSEMTNTMMPIQR